ncbi:response regulator transcription factor [Mycobacterium sp. OTB74]|jgi:DNA-binding NarL/FixJ family response regulator|uniref:response regulator transcription factor n=1 Tax=Mycobacterium sp. OTB74 TaxID=1853452 RepID=UPI002474A29F|nr:response regulator transcription factor [Mycobacterium sp. OTB74]MDH6245562.1 DNA-binding NarL/FixJ family response regulator [Mycobacterium sp. OTB74]
MAIRVVLAEDSFLVREGVRRVLESSDQVEVVATCGDLGETLGAIDDHHPDVVLTDIRMPPNRKDEGIQIARHCRAEHSTIGVVLLSQYVEPSYVRVLLDQGTEGRGYLLKEHLADLDDLLVAITAVAGGGSAIDPKVVQSLVQARALDDDERMERLSPRERQVLALIAEGRTNAAVAQQLVLSQHAVEKHINSIFSKLNLSGDQELHPRVRATLMYLAGGRS